MAVNLATGYIDLVPSARDIGKKIESELDLDNAAVDAGRAAGDKLSEGLLSRTSGTGKKLLTALGFAAAGGLALKAASDVEDAGNIIIRSTDATGKAADGLQESFKNVARGSSAGFDTIAQTLAELYQRTGLQGKALEGLTTQVVTFNRISKDGPITVDQLTKATAGFNVKGTEMGKVLDDIFRISRQTGVPVATLLTDLQTSGPILRQFGFDIEFSAGFLAKLNKAGLDANQIIPGLKKVFKDAADAGKDPQEALRGVIGQIQELVRQNDIIGARNLAVSIFGAKGAGLVDAVISGRLSLDDLNKSLKLSGDGIVETGKKTGTLSGALGVLRNNLQLALAAFATPGLQAANDLLRGVLPTIRELGKDFAALPDPIKVGLVAVVGLGLGISKIGEFATNALPGLQSLGQGAATALQLAAVRGLELAESLKAIQASELLLAGGLGIALAATAALILAVSLGDGPYERIAASAKKWADATIAGARASKNELGSLRDTQRDLETQIDHLKRGFIDINDSAQTSAVGGLETANRKNAELAEKVERLQARLRELQPEIDKVKQKHAEEGATAETTARALDQYTSATEHGTNASSALAKLTDDAKQALANLQSALIQAAGGEVAYEQAVISRDEAQDRANGTFLAVIAAIQAHDDAVNQFGADSDQARITQDALTAAQRENAKANLDLRSANLSLGQALISLREGQQKLLDQVRDGTTTREQALTQLDAEKAFLEGLQRDYPATADSINPYIFQLLRIRQEIEEAHKHDDQPIKVTVDTSQAFQALTDLINFLGGPNSPATQQLGFVATFGGGGVPGAARGAILDMPTTGGLAMLHGREAVLPLDDQIRSWQLIARSGLLDSIELPTNDGSAGGGDQFFVTAPTDDPLRLAVRISQKRRAAQFLGARR